MKSLSLVVAPVLVASACASSPAPRQDVSPTSAAIVPAQSVSSAQEARPMPKPPTSRSSDAFRPVMPGSPVPGSRISVPHQVQAGQILRGQVPVGSTVWVDGQAVAVDAEGRFEHPVPINARRELAVRIQRPSTQVRAPMTIRVQITH